MVNLIFTFNWSKERILDFLKVHNITMQQYNVLRILRGARPHYISTCDIRERMLDKRSDASRLVDRLVKQNLAEKEIDPGNRRLLKVAITHNGLDLLTKIDERFPELLFQFKNLNQTEVEQLNQLLDKLRQSV